MRSILLTFLVSVCARPLLSQGAPPHQAADQPYSMEYYYKVQWGHQQEFLQLFLKNHYPLLQKNVESGRMLSVKIETPANHTTEDGRAVYLRGHQIEALGYVTEPGAAKFRFARGLTRSARREIERRA